MPFIWNFLDHIGNTVASFGPRKTSIGWSGYSGGKQDGEGAEAHGRMTQGLQIETWELQLDMRKHHSPQVQPSTSCGVFVLEVSQALHLVLALLLAGDGLETS